jgi:hypothetical protein
MEPKITVMCTVSCTVGHGQSVIIIIIIIIIINIVVVVVVVVVAN